MSERRSSSGSELPAQQQPELWLLGVSLARKCEGCGCELGAHGVVEPYACTGCTGCTSFRLARQSLVRVR